MASRSQQYGRNQPVDTELTRRDLLRALGLGAVAVGLAACGAPLSSASGSARTSAAPGGSGGATGSARPGGSSASPRPTTAPVVTPVPSAIAGLTLRQKIGQLLVVGFTGTKAAKTSAVGKAIAAGELGGVILFDRNIASAAQLAGLTSGLSALAPDAWPLIVAVDQEGGRVLRLGPQHGFPDVPSQKSVGAHDAAYAATVYGAMAVTLSDAGINLNLAPVVDVNVNPKNPAIGALDRSFSADPAVVTALAHAEIQAHHGHGILTTIKHFPGLGSATANTDTAIVDVTKTWSEMELDPYRGLLVGDADLVMVGHLINRTLDAKYPSSLSKATIDGLLRGELGWQGPVITDDLQAVAIAKRYKQADAITAALNAGVDLLLFAAASSAATFYSDLVTSIATLVTSGRIDEARIDQAVGRVALLRAQL
jgi:beta-N-acetylhexosaminidase